MGRTTDDLLDLGVRAYNALVEWRRTTPPDGPDPDIRAIRARALVGTDISSHLEALYVAGLAAHPRLIVELGVRGGESTFVFERLARRSGADLVSVDIVDCSTVSRYERWHWQQEDDVGLGRRFRSWCEARGLEPRVDVLFVDTTHLYDHTCAEIDAWFPHLSARAVAMFHDTNARKVFQRRDGTLGLGWNNHRGVVRALERVLGIRIDERRPLTCDAAGWHVEHDPTCNGLTILRRTGDGQVP